jgi:hypothetical protein
MSTKFRKSFKNVILCKPLNKNYSYVHKFFFKIPPYSMPNAQNVATPNHNLNNNAILLNKIVNSQQINKSSGNNQNESQARSQNKNERYD